MRPNPVKRKLAAGGVALGTMMLEFATTGVGRLAAGAGAEFAVFDMEHTGWSIETIRTLMAACRCADLVPMVRPPAREYDQIARSLDVGAMGLVMPLVSTPEQARFIVQCAKYPPVGRRGAAFCIQHDDYADGDLVEKMRSANDELLIAAQIETVEGVENVEQIAAVQGIDALWIGQFDLTASMGIPGQFSHPDFVRAAQRIVRAGRAVGKAAAFGSLDLDQLRWARDQGFRLLVYLADLWIYQRALKAGLDAIRP
jgi:2-dehydro-3-deoxyglucarate aldolase/4-hydroxy-2-oxoheptanedioate aldolase